MSQQYDLVRVTTTEELGFIRLRFTQCSWVYEGQSGLTKRSLVVQSVAFPVQPKVAVAVLSRRIESRYNAITSKQI
jgi:hypothetical protein